MNFLRRKQIGRKNRIWKSWHSLKLLSGFLFIFSFNVEVIHHDHLYRFDDKRWFILVVRNRIVIVGRGGSMNLLIWKKYIDYGVFRISRRCRTTSLPLRGEDSRCVHPSVTTYSYIAWGRVLSMVYQPGIFSGTVPSTVCRFAVGCRSEGRFGY